MPHLDLAIGAALPHLFGMKLHSVVETSVFTDDAANAGMEREEVNGVIAHLAANPTAGVIMEGTGGARKFRYKKPGKGKSGGYRVVTYYAGKDMPVFLLGVFGKGEKDNLTQAEKNELKEALGQITASYKGKKR
jgi:hypothetical protein